MTKDWSIVRADACKLYGEGKSLTQVRHIMKTERGFDASLKDWGVLRSNYLEELKAIDAETARVSPVVGDVTDAAQPTRAPKRARLDSAEATENHRNHDARAHTLSSGRESRASTETFAGSQSTPAPQLERLLLTIRDVPHGHEVKKLLHQQLSHASSGVDNLLHLAAGQGDLWTLEYALDYMQSSGGSIEVTSSAERTPLELAVRGNHLECVRLLLDAGASPHRRNRAGEQPLHLAIVCGASALICMELLIHGADVNATMAPSAQTPLGLALELSHSADRNLSAKEELYVIAETLLDYHARLPIASPETAALEDDYIVQWLLWESSRGGAKSSSRSWLRHYFRVDWNPLCWYPLRCCPVHECDSFASFIFAHTDSKLAATLIQTTDVGKYGIDLAYLLVSPCRSRSSQETPISNLLRDLLLRLRGHDISFGKGKSLLQHVLSNSPKEDKVALFETMLGLRTVSPDDERSTLLELAKEDLPQEDLPQEDLPLHLRLAELLLHPGAGIVSRKFYDDLLNQYLDYLGLCRAEGGNLASVPPAFQATVLEALDLPQSQPIHAVVQFVVHVLTQLMLGNENLGVPLSLEERLGGAVDLRRRLALPEAPVSSRVAMNLVYASTQLAYQRNGQAEGSSVELSSADLRDWHWSYKSYCRPSFLGHIENQSEQ